MTEQLKPVDPRTAEPRPPIDCTPADEIPTLLNRARSAQQEWAQLPFDEKAQIFQNIIQDLEKSEDELADLCSSEMGKLNKHAKDEAHTYVRIIDKNIDLMRQALEPEDLDFDGGQTQLHWVPHGVAAVITPWNFPITMPFSLLIPTLLAGNTALFKPSEITTATGLKIAELINRHLPQDVLIPVVGADAQGKALVASEVDFIAFIGSRQVGKKILEQASQRACRVLLEMGGKDPMVVAKDADLPAAVKHAVSGAVSNSGQVCCSVERIYVEKELYPRFVEEAVNLANTVVVGERQEGRICYGSMSNQRQMELVLDQVKSAAEQGATIHCGGKQKEGPGFHIEATVISDLNDDMTIMKDETFGPVVCIQSVDSLDEGIQKANNSRYGLTATLWMGDEKQAQEEALKLEAGNIGINRPFWGSSLAPWAGAKESGFGYTRGLSGMRQFLQPRSVSVSN